MFKACSQRVNVEGIKENCKPEYYDLVECRDACVSYQGHSLGAQPLRVSAPEGLSP